MRKRPFVQPMTVETVVPTFGLWTTVIDSFRSTVVRELVHALDGQHIDLVAVEDAIEAASDADNFDELFSRAAIIEGRAISVQVRWDAANDFVQSPDLPAGAENVPPAALLAVALPYSFGLQYIEMNGGVADTREQTPW